MDEGSQSAGVVSELEKAAMRGEPPPGGTGFLEQVYYQGLCHLYARFRAGFISREQGSREKQALLTALRREQSRVSFQDKQREQTAHLWKNLEGPASDLVFGQREGDQEKSIRAARRMWEAIYRMPFPEKGRGEG